MPTTLIMNTTDSRTAKKTAIIIGAGPAGLTAAYELLKHTDVHPVIIEASPTYVGGISKTVNYKGNRIDIGGHRFFSKSDVVMDWWLSILPLGVVASDSKISYRGETRVVEDVDGSAEASDDVMLLRNRISRIYFDRTFFPYPIKLNLDTIRKLGLVKMVKIAVTYGYRVVRPRKNETSLEDFFINRFGDELYKTFFKSYTEKVWGKPCSELSAEWGAQRIKGLSITKAIQDAVLRPFRSKDLKQKDRETSLIEQFLYPKYGPGHLWEVVAKKISDQGGEFKMGTKAVGVTVEGNTVTSVEVELSDGSREVLAADYVFSTTSVKDLSRAMGGSVPVEVAEVAEALEFRNFITVGILLKKDKLHYDTSILTDTWIYIHEPGVQVGRVQVFNNWSPHLVQDKDCLWLGLEYFCDEGDDLWTASDEALITLGSQELAKMGLGEMDAVMDATVLREPKTYPVYAGAYEHFHKVQKYLDSIENLFPVGRNGMHRYNNQDHSMLTAMAAVELIKTGDTNKGPLWEINAEQEYHEEKK
jgi:protoporphyrinogen oxidase